MTFRQFLRLCATCWEEKEGKCRCSKNIADWGGILGGQQTSNHTSIALPSTQQHISISI